MTIKESLAPYRAQFGRAPMRIKIIALTLTIYILTPIDLFDILFPWMAFSDDIFLAGILLKLLYKYGSLPGEIPTTPLELIKKITKKD